MQTVYEAIPDDEGAAPTRRGPAHLIAVGALLALVALGTVFVSASFPNKGLEHLSTLSSRFTLSFANEYADQPGQVFSHAPNFPTLVPSKIVYTRSQPTS
jgi:hypothetical protein